jgi:hypothetical protein
MPMAGKRKRATLESKPVRDNRSGRCTAVMGASSNSPAE